MFTHVVTVSQALPAAVSQYVGALSPLIFLLGLIYPKRNCKIIFLILKTYDEYVGWLLCICAVNFGELFLMRLIRHTWQDSECYFHLLKVLLKRINPDAVVDSSAKQVIFVRWILRYLVIFTGATHDWDTTCALIGCELWRFRFARILEKYFIKAKKCFFRVYIASSKQGRGGEVGNFQ